ncbi:orotate phosphoribosyltransferase [Mobilisporobacter senegalensis]|uniref:Orotate phosphoribosyltransferase n=1 Tax=Mobilisporobacter senegalensis TaxID=1329262 RepID=A0A3N1XL87_9FIRM|nr:orotate phosphoribosyltransferase [Mobilisporobacter senegalensis]ROR27473.1 orotate phosphoribosyltransferase [Mobilisporobacter senegalensis]
MESREVKFYAPMNNKIALKVIPGHFATSYSHINYYIDMTSIKTRQNEAAEVAKTLAQNFNNDVIIDTIVCMDGCEVIGGFLAWELSNAGILSMNDHKTIYIISPEYNSNGQMIFRENNQPAILGKHILLLVASVTTGSTVSKSLECIQYYGGRIQGIAAIFSVIDKIDGVRIDTIFKEKDIPGYKNYNITDCPFCKSGQKVEAIVNGYGYVKL